jgi:hypothetical protein
LVEGRVRAFGDPAVKAVFAGYEPKMRAQLMALREMIFAAAENARVGPLNETLKWGQPAYRPLKAKTGTTVRLDALRNTKGGYALFVPCSTTLIATFREHYARDFVFEGKRAIIFSADGKVPEKALKHCIAMALTYHAR